MVRTSVVGVEVLREQLRVPGREAAVAADVEVPALVGGDDADVLAAGLGALAGAARDAELDLVRRAQPAVAQLERDRQAHRVLHAVAAPRRADARLHGAQRLAVGVPGLEAGVDQPLPDRRQLLDAGAEQVDPLAAGDLGVEPEVLGDLADRDQPLGRDLAAGDPRDDRVGAVLLHVGHDVVVGVLQRAPARRRGRGRCRARRGSRRRPACRCRSRGRVPCAADDLGERRQPAAPGRRRTAARGESSKCSHSALLTSTPDRSSSVVTRLLDQRQAGAAAGAGPGAAP